MARQPKAGRRRDQGVRTMARRRTGSRVAAAAALMTAIVGCSPAPSIVPSPGSSSASPAINAAATASAIASATLASASPTATATASVGPASSSARPATRWHGSGWRPTAGSSRWSPTTAGRRPGRPSCSSHGTGRWAAADGSPARQVAGAHGSRTHRATPSAAPLVLKTRRPTGTHSLPRADHTGRLPGRVVGTALASARLVPPATPMIGA